MDMPSQAEAGTTKKAASKRGNLVKLFTVVAISVTVTIVAIVFREKIMGMEKLGYPGIFLVSLVANATVIFPAPGLAFTFAMGSVFNPLLVGLVAGLGEALGELSGYAAGYAGRGMFSEDRRYARFERLTRRYGGAAVVVLSAVPAAVFDLVGIAAGAMRMPAYRFLFYTWLGKTAKTIVFAYAGAYSVTWFLDLIR